MNITAVESNTLATVGYDTALELLRLEFRTQAVYHYFDVPAEIHEELMNATSKGTYFNRFIRGHFPYSLISNPGAQAAA
jgi:hypothetical protein